MLSQAWAGQGRTAMRNGPRLRSRMHLPLQAQVHARHCQYPRHPAPVVEGTWASCLPQSSARCLHSRTVLMGSPLQPDHALHHSRRLVRQGQPAAAKPVAFCGRGRGCRGHDLRQRRQSLLGGVQQVQKPDLGSSDCNHGRHSGRPQLLLHRTLQLVQLPMRHRTPRFERLRVMQNRCRLLCRGHFRARSSTSAKALDLLHVGRRAPKHPTENQHHHVTSPQTWTHADQLVAGGQDLFGETLLMAVSRATMLVDLCLQAVVSTRWERGTCKKASH